MKQGRSRTRSSRAKFTRTFPHASRRVPRCRFSCRKILRTNSVARKSSLSQPQSLQDSPAIIRASESFRSNDTPPPADAGSQPKRSTRMFLLYIHFIVGFTFGA